MARTCGATGYSGLIVMMILNFGRTCNYLCIHGLIDILFEQVCKPGPRYWMYDPGGWPTLSRRDCTAARRRAVATGLSPKLSPARYKAMLYSLFCG